MFEELPVYVDEPAEYEPRGDHIVGHWKGRTFHIPIAVATQITVRLNKVLARWHAEQCGEVAELRGKNHAASS